ncbi:hypothetical protein Tco_1484404 [Tanacetum coccineum]
MAPEHDYSWGINPVGVVLNARPARPDHSNIATRLDNILRTEYKFIVSSWISRTTAEDLGIIRWGAGLQTDVLVFTGGGGWRGGIERKRWGPDPMRESCVSPARLWLAIQANGEEPSIARIAHFIDSILRIRDFRCGRLRRDVGLRYSTEARFELVHVGKRCGEDAGRNMGFKTTIQLLLVQGWAEMKKFSDREEEVEQGVSSGGHAYGTECANEEFGPARPCAPDPQVGGCMGCDCDFYASREWEPKSDGRGRCIMAPKQMTQAAIAKLVSDEVAKALAADRATRDATGAGGPGGTLKLPPSV